MNWKQIVLLLAVACLAFGLFVWPTPYRIEVRSLAGGQLMLVYRVTRFTGHARYVGAWVENPKSFSH